MELVEKKINGVLLLFFFMLLVFVLMNGRIASRIEKKQHLIDQHDPLYSLPE